VKARFGLIDKVVRWRRLGAPRADVTGDSTRTG
jgi:hypothetical protein